MNPGVDQAPVATVVLRSGAAKFPMVSFDQPASFCRAYFAESERAAASIDPDQFDRAVAVLVEAYCGDATVFSCGNGGSASIANHLQCDHLKGIRNATDLSPRVVSLTSNIELITAITNDLGYEEVFAFQLQSQARPGDVLVVISSSGQSGNIIRALRWAKEHHLRTIAFTGFTGGEARVLAEISLHVDSFNYGVIEDIHQASMHAMAQFIRQSRMTSDAVVRNTF